MTHASGAGAIELTVLAMPSATFVSACGSRKSPGGGRARFV